MFFISFIPFFAFFSIITLTLYFGRKNFCISTFFLKNPELKRANILDEGVFNCCLIGEVPEIVALLDTRINLDSLHMFNLEE